jgi:DNA-binding CsgD family transcriptional regulator
MVPIIQAAKAGRQMRVDFKDDLADGLDIAAPPRSRVGVTTQQPIPPPELAQLTEGQRDCLRLVYNHMTSKDIARVLNVSPHTVDMRLRTAMRTLSVASRIEAARLLVQHEAGGETLPDAYQPLIYQTPDVVQDSDPSTLGLPASVGTDDPAHLDPSARLSPDVGPPAYGPPRIAGAPVSFAYQHPSSGVGVEATDHGIDSPLLAGSVPWGRRNNLGVGARLAWIFIIALGSILAFAAVLASFAALRAIL